MEKKISIIEHLMKNRCINIEMYSAHGEIHRMSMDFYLTEEEYEKIEKNALGKPNHEYLLNEYKESIKLTQFEYDLLSIEYDRHYDPSEWKPYMKAWWHRGYLLSLKDLDMTIGDILDNCEVIEDE